MQGALAETFLRCLTVFGGGMQDEEDETDHLPLRLGDTVVISNLRKLKISRLIAGFMAAPGWPALNA